jgi:hypothetical protein
MIKDLLSIHCDLAKPEDQIKGMLKMAHNKKILTHFLPV